MVKVKDILDLLPPDCNIYIADSEGEDLEWGTADELHHSKFRECDVGRITPYFIGGSKNTPAENGLTINV